MASALERLEEDKAALAERLAGFERVARVDLRRDMMMQQQQQQQQTMMMQQQQQQQTTMMQQQQSMMQPATAMGAPSAPQVVQGVPAFK